MSAWMGEKVGVPVFVCKCVIEQIAYVYVNSVYPVAIYESVIYAQSRHLCKSHTSPTSQKCQRKALRADAE